MYIYRKEAVEYRIYKNKPVYKYYSLQAFEENLKKQLQKSDTTGGSGSPLDLSRFKSKFQAELQKGIEEAREDLKRRQQK
jgi:hypothetical protein